MTIAAVVLQAGPFNGNGVTTGFPFTFRCFGKTEMTWTRRSVAGVEAVLVLDLDYSVVLNADQNATPGGTVTFPIGGSAYAILAVGEKLVGVSNAPETQLVDLVAAGGFFPEVIEGALDRAVLLIQQLSQLFTRTLTYPVTDTTTSATLPTSTQRANMFLAFDASGSPIAAAAASGGAPVSVAMQPVVSAASLAAARAAMGVNPSLATASITGAYTTVAADINKVLQCAGTFTLSLGDAATLAAGWYATVKVISGTVTIGRVTAGNTIDGVAANLVLKAGQSAAFAVNQAVNGFNCTSNNPVFNDTADPTKQLAYSLSGFTTGATRVQTPANFDHPTGAGFEVCDGRLTLTTATAVTTADVTAAGTLFFTPYKGDLIGLYDGTKWNISRFAEVSIAVPAALSQMYDVFGYDNAGTFTLELLAWTNDTTRATALVLQNGVLVKTGATTRRYLGSMRSTGVANQTEDSLVKRYVWNNYNRIRRPMSRNEGAASWTYSTAAFRQANANAANQLDLVIGAAEDAVRASVYNSVQNSTATQRIVHVGIGIDSTTVNSAQIDAGHATGTYEATVSAHYVGSPGIGRHTLVWLEWATGGDTQTWNASAFSASFASGITGELMG